MRAAVVATAASLLSAGCGSSSRDSATDVPAFSVTPAAAPADPHASLFDPARHMRIAEVKPGMTGFGVSIFRGTAVERFEVEVLSVLRNFSPGHDVILITCRGANLEHTGAIAGMSGSPIYLRDDAGRDRMIGAFAYGWPRAKDPIAGVQPIEYMLDLPVTAASPTSGPTTNPASNPTSGPATAASARVTSAWQWGEAQALAREAFAPADARPLADRGPTGRTGGDWPALRPLATPLMSTGLSPAAADALSRAVGRWNLAPLQAGGGGGSADPVLPPGKLSPGSVLAVPLMTGDADLTAIGTCTEVIGDRAFGFGHPFNNEGRVALPMGPGHIHGVVANLDTSFKLGAMSAATGTLTADAAVGVGGTVGPAPVTAPIDVTVRDADAGSSHTYRFQAAVHPKFTPLLAGVALSSAASGASELPQYNTVDWTVSLSFANGRTVTLADRGVNLEATALMTLPAAALLAASENPFERVPVRSVSATLNVSRKVTDGTIVEVNLPRAKYKPGEALKAFVTYRPFRGEEAVLPVEMELPKDLTAGVYRFVVGDADRFAVDEQMTRPFRFSARTAAEVFDVIQDATASRHDAVYLRLIRQPDGVAVGRTALPLLPSARRQVLLESGRSDTTAFVSSATKVVPAGRVMAGQAEFQITVETPTRPGGAGGRGATSRPAVPVHVDEPKPPKAGGVDVIPAQ